MKYLAELFTFVFFMLYFSASAFYGWFGLPPYIWMPIVFLYPIGLSIIGKYLIQKGIINEC